jgi:hypothetical protein
VTQTADAALAAAIDEFRRIQKAPAESCTRPDIEHLAATWRNTAELLLHALEDFGKNRLLDLESIYDNTFDTRCPRDVGQLLLDAIAGRKLEGGFSPSTPQRRAQGGFAPAAPAKRRQYREKLRRWNRTNLNMPCQVDAKGQSIGATLRNISLGGALLDGLPFLLRGTPLSVTLPNGRVLEAIAMWARAGSLGVGFVEQLMFDDPLVENTGIL